MVFILDLLNVEYAYVDAILDLGRAVMLKEDGFFKEFLHLGIFFCGVKARQMCVFVVVFRLWGFLEMKVLSMESRWTLKCFFSMYSDLVVGNLEHAQCFYCHYKKTMFFLTSEKTPIGVILNMGFVFLDVT